MDYHPYDLKLKEASWREAKMLIQLVMECNTTEKQIDLVGAIIWDYKNHIEELRKQLDGFLDEKYRRYIGQQEFYKTGKTSKKRSRSSVGSEYNPAKVKVARSSRAGNAKTHALNPNYGSGI